jgi:putative peptidoglycan lipid II flippase
VKVQGGVVRAMTLVVGSSALGSAIGFLKNVLAASYFGTSGSMDAYLVALVLPDLVSNFALTGAFNFIPLFAEQMAISDEAGWRAANKMVTYWLTLLLVVLIVVVVLTPWIVGVIAPGFGGAQRERTITISRVLFLMTASVATSEVLSLPLLAERRFFAVAASEVAFQIGSTAFLVAFRGWGISALVWGMVCGGLVQLLVVVVGLGDVRRRLRLDLDLRAPIVRRMLGLTMPTYIGNMSAKLNSVINRGFGSLLPEGAVSSLQYGMTLIDAPVSLLASPATRTLFPFLASQFTEDEKRARANLSRALFSLTAMFAPIAVGIYMLARPIVRIMFQRGSFTGHSTDLTVGALQIYAPLILTLALNGLLTAAFNARKNTQMPMRVGVLRVALNASLCFAFVPSFGVRGIALSNTVADFVKVLLLGFFLWRVFPREEAGSTLTSMGRLVPPLALMALVVYPAGRAVMAANSWLATVLSLVAVALLGAVVYLATFALFCRAEFAHYAAIARDELERLRARFGFASAEGVGR